MTKPKAKQAAKPKSPPKPKAAPFKPGDLSIPEDGSIPPFLLVENRIPLTRAQKAALEKRLQKAATAEKADPRMPKGISPEEWKEVKAKLAAMAKAEQEQFTKMNAPIEPPPEPKREKKVTAQERIAAIATAPPILKKPPQEGSRKRKVYEALIKGGPDAAMKAASKLDLKEGTVRSWFGAWTRQAESEQATAPVPKPKGRKGAPAPVEPVIDRHPRKDGKRRVYLLSTGTHAQGTVMQEGLEQSIVRWDNGNEDIVINKWVADLPTNGARR